MSTYKIPTEDPERFDISMFAKSIESKFFDPETMRFFGSILEQPVYSDGKHGAFFVTSEQLTKEVKQEIVPSLIRPADRMVDKLMSNDRVKVRSVRSMEGMDKTEDRFWKVRHASYENETIRTVKDDDIRYVCLQDADEAAKAAADAVRNA